MLVENIISEARKKLTAEESAGRIWFDCEAIHGLLDAIERAAEEENDPKKHELNLERYRADLAHFVSAKSAQWELDREEFKQVLAMGQSALRASLLINGGASVALLAFIGHIITSGVEAKSIISFANAMIFFVVGVALAGIAFGTTYLGQHAFSMSDKNQNSGVAIQIVTIMIVVLSFFAFFCGTGTAYHGFISLAKSS